MSSNFRSQTLDLGLVLSSFQDHEEDDDDDDDNRRSLHGVHDYENSSDENSCQPPNHQSQESQSACIQNKVDQKYDYDEIDADCDPELDKKVTQDHGSERGVKNIYRGLIRDQEQYENLLRSRVDKERNEGLRTYTDTFPGDPLVQRAWAKKIFDAILDLDGIIDKKTKYHNNSSQAARRIRDGYYPDIEIEKIAWKLMVGYQTPWHAGIYLN